MTNDSITNDIAEVLAKAGLDIQSGPAKLALDTVRKALADAKLLQHPLAGTHAREKGVEVEERGDVIDVEARVLDSDEPAFAHTEAPQAHSDGRFLRCAYAGVAGSRTYRLYVPSTYANEPMPLVMMLHGCKQTPEDFAVGTRLNQLAEAHGLLVAYPAQPTKANGSRCWNWFEPGNQSRTGSEPAILAGIVKDIGATYRVDQGRVFVAGLSAGAAMAVILGETHPEVFAAVAAHSGLPRGAAHDTPSAFAAMGGRPTMDLSKQAQGTLQPESAVRTIVFHGDRDATVVLRNGAAIAERAIARFEADGVALTGTSEAHESNGRRLTRVTHRAPDQRALVEQWTVHGGAHAWSGGDANGSFTDPKGPDASLEMIRFFLASGTGRV